MSFTPRLDHLDAMQREPIGTFSALRRPSPMASQYKRQSEMYGQALRTLSRAARRGDANAAMTAISLRDKANEDGFTPGGIGRSEDFQPTVAGREQSLMRRNSLMEQANVNDAQAARESVNPNATVGAGRGTPLSRSGPTSSWDSDGNGVPNSIQRPDLPVNPLSFGGRSLSRRRSPLGY